VLILHGDKDTLVPLSQSELFRDALKAAGVEHELVVVAGAGHGPAVFNKDTTPKMAAFFDKHLKK
jgi:dipeptidyl aminopeptidase/acylaminoacyl peptidase